MSNQKVLKNSKKDSAARIAIISRVGTKMKPISTMIYVYKKIKMTELALMMITSIMQTQVNKRILDNHNYYLNFQITTYVLCIPSSWNL